MTDREDDRTTPYRTVAERAAAPLSVGDSTFIATIGPVESIEEATAFVRDVETRYSDATHNVPAYRIRSDPFREWSSDDGEPSGSAGKPALNVLDGEDLENVAVVVTRYFGGTKLGYGGLVGAYSAAVREAIDATEVVEKRPQTRVRAVVDYDDSGTVRGILESAGVTFEASYDARVEFLVTVPVDRVDELLDRLRSATSGRIELS